MNTPIDNKKLMLKLSLIESKLTKLSEIIDSIKIQDDRLISVQDAAGILSVSDDTIRRMIRTGEIKAKLDGRAYKILESQILRKIKYKEAPNCEEFDAF